MVKGSVDMSLEDFRKNLEEEIEGILDEDFKIDITETDIVPSLDDSGITYPNLETGVQKCKLIETCVLYIDLRKSTDLNLTHRRETMSKLYSTFIRSIMKSAGEYNGKVRNVIGDRVMILFDSDNCFGNAYKTAVLLNSVIAKLLDKHFKNNEIKAGIGIDYGKMLVTKGGIIKKGYENTNYKSLVWLGRPANVASKLTDLANKAIETTSSEKVHYLERSKEPYGHNRSNISIEEFFEVDLFMYPGWEKNSPGFTEPSFRNKNLPLTFYYLRNKIDKRNKSITTKPILMTEVVYNGVLKEASEMQSVKEKRITEVKNLQVPGYTGKVYGVNTWYTAFE